MPVCVLSWIGSSLETRLLGCSRNLETVPQPVNGISPFPAYFPLEGVPSICKPGGLFSFKICSGQNPFFFGSSHPQGRLFFIYPFNILSRDTVL